MEKLVGLLVADTEATLAPLLAGSDKDTDAAVKTGAAEIDLGSVL
jgi:hypothetical protein